MMYGLPPYTLTAISTELGRHQEVEVATLYGSRAMGTFRTGSDIDLCLQGAGLDLTALQHIETRLDDLDLPYKIDLSLQHHIDNPELLEHIARVGKVIYKRATSEGG